MTTYNIPLIRRVYDHLVRYPIEHNQSSWMTCIAGHTIRIHGEYALLRTGNPLTDGFQSIDFRTGALHDTEELAARLLGMADEEACGLFTCSEQDAIDWLGDINAAYETTILDALAADMMETGS
ncbi:hypothetical protein IU443_28605 [Nocardia farcinica]|uniref:Uncharacterized protein n=1 Tax=Nocardia farcinica TaxID=37329 RepID=A0A0H5P9Z9_NOCFR|nr:hypothetical protein [Nocardia farcinica]AXK88566.1 hypothetical protein DXT66_25745 [Nocardia farcinica]MBF6393894.1 hypothetical protein [Nocardia farcinica]PFW98872.1 hypothetical protein CJ469_05833 [Nocardia farcinica]PFX04478.1 hypothetical protein CJ468_05454 [Nocardia farcinica]CRY84263.1 Uncharacterised protein [Nocardia farcinica]